MGNQPGCLLALRGAERSGLSRGIRCLYDNEMAQSSWLIPIFGRDPSVDSDNLNPTGYTDSLNCSSNRLAGDRNFHPDERKHV